MAGKYRAEQAGGPAEEGPDLFLSYLAERLPLVERALAEAMPRPMMEAESAWETGSAAGTPTVDLDDYLYQPLARFTASGGKRVRPVLALLGAEAVGGRAEDALSCGVAIELFQSAALIHDDIADRSELRRGEPCLYVTEGTGVAIIVGDLALTEVFEAVLADGALAPERKVRVLQELVRMERHTLEGQALDLGWARDGRWDVTSDSYLYMIDAKTAWYSVAVPLYVGALCGGADEERAAGLLALGRHAGLAFQLQDDLLNLVGDAAAQGKDFRSDITEGKRTLAVVWALEHLDETDRERLQGILEQGTSDPRELAAAVELIEQGGGIDRCRALARAEAASAQAGAHALARAGSISPKARDLLCSMAAFFVERTR